MLVTEISAETMERWRVTPQSLRTTTKIYLSITALIWITAIVCIATSIWSISYTRPASSKKDASRTFISGEIPVHAPKGLISLAPLLLVISATLVGGFTNHLRSITLRWGLWREERLAFNSNLAAFQLASRVSLNGWPTNLVYVLCLVLSLTASSQTFIGFSEMGGSRTFVVVNGIALATLGVSVMGQAILAAWSIVRIEKKALPWGVDPMTTAVTCLHEGLIRRKDRCMIAAGYSGRPRGMCSLRGVPSLSLYRASTSVSSIFFRDTSYTRRFLFKCNTDPKFQQSSVSLPVVKRVQQRHVVWYDESPLCCGLST